MTVEEQTNKAIEAINKIEGETWVHDIVDGITYHEAHIPYKTEALNDVGFIFWAIIPLENGDCVKVTTPLFTGDLSPEEVWAGEYDVTDSFTLPDHVQDVDKWMKENTTTSKAPSVVELFAKALTNRETQNES